MRRRASSEDIVLREFSPQVAIMAKRLRRWIIAVGGVSWLCGCVYAAVFWAAVCGVPRAVWACWILLRRRGRGGKQIVLVITNKNYVINYGLCIQL